MGLGAENIVNLLVDSLSIEELEAALHRKKGISRLIPKPMNEKERLLDEYRKRMLELGILHPPMND